MSKQKEIFDKINASIISALEQGIVPWRCPYKPQQSSRGHVYRGINKLVLNLKCVLDGYTSPVWYTFNAAKYRGGQVKKGEKATQIVHYKMNKSKRKDENGEHIWYPSFRYFNVFNENQIQFLEMPEENTESNQDAEDVVQQYLDREMIAVTNSPQCAWYNVKEDKINVPLPKLFGDPALYYSTLFHEMGHSTGAENRLNREALRDLGKEHLYSQEELVAEMTSAYLCGYTGTKMYSQNTAAYLHHWMEKLKDDPKCLHKACDQAERAYQYILKGEIDEDLQEKEDGQTRT